MRFPLARDQCVLRIGVSPFGHLRITGCSPPPRSLSQARHVLHRFSKPRHPPYALNYPVVDFDNFYSKYNFFPLFILSYSLFKMRAVISHPLSSDKDTGRTIHGTNEKPRTYAAHCVQQNTGVLGIVSRFCDNQCNDGIHLVCQVILLGCEILSRTHGERLWKNNIRSDLSRSGSCYQECF